MKPRILLLAVLMCCGTLLPAQWTAFGDSLPSFVIGFVEHDGKLLSHSFPSPYVYEWDGTEWQSSGDPIPGAGGIHMLRPMGDTLWAAAYASATTGMNVWFRTPSTTWDSLPGRIRKVGSSLYPSIYDLMMYQGDLYVAGEFNRVGTDTILGLARWDGTQWEKCGSGLSLGMPPYTALIYPHQLLEWDGKLVVVGNFKNAGGMAANGVAAWDGTAWHTFAAGFNKSAYGAEVYQGQLFVGGEFTQSTAGDTLLCVARWDGASWADAGFEVTRVGSPGLTPFVHTLKALGSDLFLAGGFNRVLNYTGTHVAGSLLRFDGVDVDTLFGGVNGDAEGLHAWMGGLLAGGDFTDAGGTPASNVSWLSGAVGIQPLPNLPAMVWPNPTSGLLHLDGLNSTLTHYEITDLGGRVLRDGARPPILDLGGLPRGFTASPSAAALPGPSQSRWR